MSCGLVREKYFEPGSGQLMEKGKEVTSGGCKNKMSAEETELVERDTDGWRVGMKAQEYLPEHDTAYAAEQAQQYDNRKTRRTDAQMA